MSRPRRAGERLAARAVIALMRAVPALFTVGWLVAAAVWLVQGWLERGVAAVAVALIAASFGVRIELFSGR
jgi:hypothetical protein